MLSDLRYIWRTRQWRFRLTVILATALSVAAATSIFAFVHGVLLSPLPFPQSEQLVAIVETDKGRATGGSPVRVYDWLQAPSIEHVAGVYGESYTVSFGELPERIAGLRTFGDYFGTLRVQAALGRTFSAPEMRGLGARVAVVTHDLWAARFNADSNAIGRTFEVNGEPHTLIGVLPAGVAMEDARIIVPEPDPKMPRSARFLTQIARVRDGVPLGKVETELKTVAGILQKQYPDTDANLGVSLQPLREVLTADARTPLLVLLGAVAALVMMAVLNVAGLFQVQFTQRSPELAVRIALGAGRGRLVRLVAAESTMLALIGGAFGVLGAVWGIELLKSLAPEGLPRLADVRMSAAAALFAAGVTLLVALAGALGPVVRLTWAGWSPSLRDGARGATRRRRLQPVLLGSQIAVTVVLLVAGALLARTYLNLQARPLGFKPDNLLTFRLSMPWQAEPARLHGVYTRLLEAVERIPGVNSAALTDRLPLDGGSMSGEVLLPGRTAEVSEGTGVSMRVISPKYHETMRVPLRSGRFLSERDLHAKRAVINETAARRFFDGVDPIGRHIGLRWRSAAGDPIFEIVGVAGDLPDFDRERESAPAMYVPYTQSFWPLAHFAVRTEGDPTAIVAAVRRAAAEVNPEHAIEQVQTAEAFIQTRRHIDAVQAWFVGAFGAAALAIAAVGIYALLAASVAAQKTEICIRLALGAQPSEVSSRTMWGAGRILLAGSLPGVLLAWFAARALGSRLFGVSSLDPVAWGSALVAVVAAGLLAAWFPARRAASLDPAAVLRDSG